MRNANPVVVKPRESRLGAPQRVFGDEVSIKLSSKDTGGLMVCCEIVKEPGADSPARVHRYEDAWCYVLEGNFAFEVGASRIDAGPGLSIFIPRDVPYRYCNTGEGTGRLLLIAVPGGLDRFYSDAGAADEVSAATLEKHGMTLVNSTKEKI